MKEIIIEGNGIKIIDRCQSNINHYGKEYLAGNLTFLDLQLKVGREFKSLFYRVSDIFENYITDNNLTKTNTTYEEVVDLIFEKFEWKLSDFLKKYIKKIDIENQYYSLPKIQEDFSFDFWTLVRE